MINADPGQGTVVFGVNPDGVIVGVEPGNLDSAQQSLERTIQSKFAPAIQCTINAEEVDGKWLVFVGANRNRAISYHEFDGRAYIREGTVTRQLTFDEKQSLQRQRNRDLHNGPWACSGCGSFAGTFSGVTMTPQGPKKNYNCSCGGEFWPAM